MLSPRFARAGASIIIPIIAFAAPAAYRSVGSAAEARLLAPTPPAFSRAVPGEKPRAALVDAAGPLHAADIALRFDRARRERLVADTVALNTLAAAAAVRVRTSTSARVLSSTPVPAPTVGMSSPAATPSSSELDSVMACIRSVESGDYTEHSHPDSGSGAYQYVPSTWQTWSARAGYGGYQLAYEAPPDVQDAVTRYVLTNGGAGNWNPRYGPDPCTVGHFGA